MRETTDLHLANAFRRHFPAIIIARTLSRDIFERSSSEESSPETFLSDLYLADARRRHFRAVIFARTLGKEISGPASCEDRSIETFSSAPCMHQHEHRCLLYVLRNSSSRGHEALIFCVLK